jgi:hypothetical protein
LGRYEARDGTEPAFKGRQDVLCLRERAAKVPYIVPAIEKSEKRKVLREQHCSKFHGILTIDAAAKRAKPPRQQHPRKMESTRAWAVGKIAARKDLTFEVTGAQIMALVDFCAAPLAPSVRA